MHWVVQEGFDHDPGMVQLKELLVRYEIPHTLVKVVPFVGELVPEPQIPDGEMVFCSGSYSMRHAAKKNGWFPGVFDLEGVAHHPYLNQWSQHMLNDDAVFSTFENVMWVAEENFWKEFFLRPLQDSKVFAGNVFSIDEYNEWRTKVVVLEEDDGTSLRRDTKVLVSSPKKIHSEFRFFIVNRNVVTASQYKSGNQVLYSTCVDEELIHFANARAAEWNPADAYCLDLARTPDGIRFVEINTINSCGLYAADVNRLLQAIETMYVSP